MSINNNFLKVFFFGRTTIALWTYGIRVYERTSKGCLDVRPQNKWVEIMSEYG